MYGGMSTIWLLMLLSASARGWKLGVIFVARLVLSKNLPVSSVSGTFYIYYVLIGTLIVYGAIMAGVIAYWVRFCGLYTHMLAVICNVIRLRIGSIYFMLFPRKTKS